MLVVESSEALRHREAEPQTKPNGTTSSFARSTTEDESAMEDRCLMGGWDWENSFLVTIGY